MPARKLIGIFGGTFDPVHNGHLRCAVEVLEQTRLHEVRLLPCNIPPHRDAPMASSDHRLAMLRLAVREYPKLVVDDREILRGGVSYMVDTLESLSIDYPHDSLVLLLGEDAFLGLPSWHRWKELFKLTHIVLMQRPGTKKTIPEALEKEVRGRHIAYAQQLNHASNGSVLSLPVTQLAIAATHIRQLIGQHHSPRYLMPSVVADYIASAGVYREKES